MKRIFIVGVLLVYSGSYFCQKEVQQAYLNNNSTEIQLDNPNFNFDEEFYSHQLFFFGFVHGSATPQKIDLELIKNLSKNGIRYYAPEVDYSLAFFLNQYLQTGKEEVLEYALMYYRYQAPQDASIQFKNKWRSLYRYNKNLEENKKIQILGFDKCKSKELRLTHIAFLAPKKATSNSLIDSLNYFQNYEIQELEINSGKKIYKSGKGFDYYLSTHKSRFFDRIIAEYQKDSLGFLRAFGENSEGLAHILNQSKHRNREEAMYENFRAVALPLIKSKEKVYANYGYMHVQQSKINGYEYIADKIKNRTTTKVVSVIGMMQKSVCMKEREYKKEEIQVKDLTLKTITYKGYKTSSFYDGDSFIEKVNGIKLLQNASKSDVTLFKLSGANSPFNNSILFTNFSRGNRAWEIEPDSSTTDYFQYIFLINNSQACIPFEEEKK